MNRKLPNETTWICIFAMGCTLFCNLLTERIKYLKYVIEFEKFVIQYLITTI